MTIAANQLVPSREDLVIELGIPCAQSTAITDADGNPVDLTAWSARLTLRASFDAPTPIAAYTDTNGLTLGGALGTVTFAFTVQPDDVATGSGVYDLVLVDGSGVAGKAKYGDVIFVPLVST